MRKFLCGILAAALLLSLIPIGGTTTALAATDYSNVRVLLSTGNTNSLTIPVSGSYFLKENGASFKNGTLSVQVSGNKLVVSHSSAGELYRGATVQIMRESIAPSAGYLRLATSGVTRSFLGHLTLKYSGGAIRAINTVPLPHYLYGVVAYEMSDTFPIEALKAQAVAAKCYVLSGMTGGSDYDIRDTAEDQVYKGYNSSYKNVINAVDATYNVGLYLGSSILCSYFAASNGGVTSLPSDAWSGTNRYTWDKAYARVEDPYDIANPMSVQESINVPKDGDNAKIGAALSNYLRGRAAKVLRDSGYIGARDGVVAIDSVDSFEIVKGTTANIEMTAIVQYEDGSQDDMSFDYNFDLNEFVWNGVMTLSNLRIFTITETNKGYTVYHGRYGHGVGLSQRGAQQMASGKNWDYERILAFYYPGAKLKSMGIAAPVDPTKPADTSGTGSTGGVVDTPDVTDGNTVAAYGEVTSSTLNLRAQPNTSGKILQRLVKGDKLDIYDYVQNSTWYFCRYKGTDGYVSAQYIKLSSSSDSTAGTDSSSGGDTSGTSDTPITGGAAGVITADGVSLRSNPSSSRGTILAKLALNAQVSVVSEVSGFYAVVADGMQGYVSKSYVKIVSTGSSGSSDTSGSSGSSGTAASYGVTTGSVNMRKGAGTKYDIITKLAKGKELTLLGLENGWYSVSVDGKTGYVIDDYVKVTKTDPTGGATGGSSAADTGGKTWSGVVVNGWVRMRSSTDLSTQSNIIGTYDEGTALTILAQSGNFYLVVADGKQGYMHKDYVQVTGENAASQTGVTTANVYLRGGPGSSHKVLTTLKKGASITILGSSGEYYQAQSGSYTGYLVKKYVSVQ